MTTQIPAVRLGSVKELESTKFRAWMSMVNALAGQWGLRQHTNWSKVWEYPWLWFAGLGSINWDNRHLVDIGSEISPFPWLVASLGARVTLVETDPQWRPTWEQLRNMLDVNVDWHVVQSEQLPLPNACADVVTSFSVIEHQPNKVQVVDEVVRVLKPGGMFACSFDICEPSFGMTFPQWNGEALTMSEFERIVWRHSGFGSAKRIPSWNTGDIHTFIEWHRRSADHHNYTVGAAVLYKR